MNIKPHFHGSDLEKIEEYYHIPQEDIVCFGANINPLGISQTAWDELKKHPEIMSQYPDRDYTSLRRTISEYCRIPAEYILVGNGSTELISLIISQYAPKKALLLGPTYSEYERELSFVGGTIETYNLSAAQNFRLDIDDFCHALDSGIDLLIICNPNNPTSSAITVSDMRAILSACRAHDIFVMVDETYVEFAPDMDAVTSVPLTQEFENLMVLRGVSKFFAAPGLRLGYGVTGNAALLKQLKLHQNPWSLNSIGAYLGESMLSDHDYIERTRALTCAERTRILSELRTWPSIRVFEPSANFILVQLLREGLTAYDVFEHCIKQGLMIRECSNFQSLDGEFIRFCFMNPEDNIRLLTCLKEIV